MDSIQRKSKRRAPLLKCIIGAVIGAIAGLAIGYWAAFYFGPAALAIGFVEGLIIGYGVVAVR